MGVSRRQLVKTEYHRNEVNINSGFYIQLPPDDVIDDVAVVFPEIDHDDCCSSNRETRNFLSECTGAFNPVNINCVEVTYLTSDDNVEVTLRGNPEKIIQLVDTDALKNYNIVHYYTPNKEVSRRQLVKTEYHRNEVNI